LLLSTY